MGHTLDSPLTSQYRLWISGVGRADAEDTVLELTTLADGVMLLAADVMLAALVALATDAEVALGAAEVDEAADVLLGSAEAELAD